MGISRLVVFDCDGVLVDSEGLSEQAYARVFAPHGVEITHAFFEQFIGMQQPDILDRIAALTGVRLPPAEEGLLWDTIRQLFETELQPTAGLVPFLDGLRCPRCVASSSSPERIAVSLGVTGLAGYFGDALFSARMVRRGKPAPDLFELAARTLATAPADCVVIEDSRHGIAGAIAAGMTAIGYTGGSHSYPGHADRLAAAGAHAVCADWNAVRSALERFGFA